MKMPSHCHGDRRQFITSVIPICGAACFLDVGHAAAFQATQEAQEPATDPFERLLEEEFTYRRFFAIRYHEFIQLVRALEQEWGKDRLIPFLKKNAEDRRRRAGQDQARKLGDNSLSAFAGRLRPPAYKNLLVYEIVEDTETAFEMKVTKCIWARTFLGAGLGDIGYAHICHGDYSGIEGFNPALRMVRDKTLMQGHECCNHRYVAGELSSAGGRPVDR